MNIKIIALFFSTFVCCNIVYANEEIANHEYTVRITSPTGKNIPINGTMMHWPVRGQGPAGFYDFKATRQLTPYTSKVTASEIMLNIASMTSELKVEIIASDKNAPVPRFAGQGNYIMLYTNGVNDTFVSTR